MIGRKEDELEENMIGRELEEDGLEKMEIEERKKIERERKEKIKKRWIGRKDDWCNRKIN